MGGGGGGPGGGWGLGGGGRGLRWGGDGVGYAVRCGWVHKGWASRAAWVLLASWLALPCLPSLLGGLLDMARKFNPNPEPDTRTDLLAVPQAERDALQIDDEGRVREYLALR